MKTSSIAARMERLPLSWLHYKLLVIHGFGWLFDALDVGLVTFVVVALAKDWGLSEATVGLVNSAGLAGMCVGAGLCGAIADRFGRKRIFQLTLAVFAVATLLCAIAWSPASMIAFRFLVGLGLGGELPVVSSLMSEFVPGRYRGRFLVLLESFWAVGWFVAAVVAVVVIQPFGWRVGFLVGALPAAYIWVIRRKLPESPRWYESKGRHAEADRVMTELEAESSRRTGGGRGRGDTETRGRGDVLDPRVSVSPCPRVPISPPPLPLAPPPHLSLTGWAAFAELWTKAHRRHTIMLWILWFGLVFGYYGTFVWLPSLLVREGYSLVNSFRYVVIITLAQVPGIATAPFVVDRIGRKPALVGYLVLTAGSAYMFGQATTVVGILVWASLMAFFNLGAWGAVYTYTPELYPTHIRATGAGAATAFGRVGGVIAPIAVGLLLSVPSIGRAGVLLMNACLLLVAALAVAILGTETRGRTLEEIAAAEEVAAGKRRRDAGTPGRREGKGDQTAGIEEVTETP